MTSVVKQQQLDWRRQQIIECLSDGYSRTEICQKVQLDRVTVHRDIHFIQQQAQENLQHHIHETVPEEYQNCMTGMKRNLRQTLEIAETVTDPKTKLQARAIANDCYKYIMDLVTNGVVVTDALSYVNGKTEKLAEAVKSDKEIFVEMEPEPTEEIEDKTTNDVF
ncbi:MAG TPA: helix-turn-helix domain-containing protein [Nitrososphaeraceae archaeon]|nr:helix-turn-helix domain-containing protein [Nitrososphaeraceae archaeon]